MDDRILMFFFGLIVGILMYVNIKYNQKEMSGFTLIRAWGVVIAGIMVAIICFLKYLYNL